MSGQTGVEDTISLMPEAKHLLPNMLKVSPMERQAIAKIVEHPLFWSGEAKIQYLGEKVGMSLVTKNSKKQSISKADHRFINELELAMDEQLGPYNEAAPEAGGSWSRMLDSRYPLIGSWGQQRPPQDEEHHYYIYGGPQTAKQQKTVGHREAALRAGKLNKGQAPKELRSVGCFASCATCTHTAYNLWKPGISSPRRR